MGAQLTSLGNPGVEKCIPIAYAQLRMFLPSVGSVSQVPEP